jgi:hypothetical protein
MDWDRVIERNTEALKHVLATLVAMAATAGCPSTLPRHLHRAVLRLLRPVEAATRRLVIIAARELPAPVLPSRKPKPPLVQSRAVRLIRPRDLGLARYNAAVMPRLAQRTWSLPMADPLKPLSLSNGGPRRRAVANRGMPRIWFPGAAMPARMPPPPSGDDPIDATRLRLRLAGVGRALADLPGEARRFARWKARHCRDVADAQNEDARRSVRRVSPLRPGRAPGWREQPGHRVHEVLADLHYFAREVLAKPDTS